MKIIKKFTAIQVGREITNDYYNPTFSFGQKTGPYYDERIPVEEHDTEQEAAEYAFGEDPFATWLILPIIRFETEHLTIEDYGNI